jgi:hypothetical protein
LGGIVNVRTITRWCSNKAISEIDPKKSMFIIFFSGEKLVFFVSWPMGKNLVSYYFCNTVLDAVEAGSPAGTRKATLRDFHIHTDNCKVRNSKLMKGKFDEIRLI